MLAYLVAGLRPFVFDVPRYYGENRLLRLPDGALRFIEPSTARTPTRPALLDAVIDERAFTILLELRPRTSAERSRGRILSISRDRYRTNLLVGQDGADLVVGTRGPARRPERLRWFRVKDAFERDAWHVVRLEAGSDRLTANVDGRQRLVALLGPHGLRAWDPDVRIVLGNDGTNEPGWEGDIRRAVVEVGDRSIDYLAPGALYVPQSWWHVPAKPPTGDRRRAVTDIVLNVVGFVPFGLLVSKAAPGRRPVVLALAASLLLSGAMEVGQVFVVPRDPSLLDVALNVLGATAGAWLARPAATTVER